MSVGAVRLSKFEKFLSVFTKIRPGEGRGILILFVHAFLLLLAYYLIRPVREALILTEGDAQIRSYAAALQALALLLIIPAYSALFRAHSSSLLIQRVNIFFAINLLIFAGLGAGGLRFGAWFFIWAGIFNVFVVANFWAFAADLFNVKSGKRLFALIAVGATAGAWVGAKINKELFAEFGPYGMMFAAALVLFTTVFLSSAAEQSIPKESRADAEVGEIPERSGALGGFEVVFKNRYLLLIALMVFVINWLTAAGDNILSASLNLRFDELVASGLTLDKQTYIGSFYGEFFSNVTLIGFVVQLFLVSRFFRWFGVHGTLMIPVLLFLGGFLAIGFIPIFALMQWVFTIHKANDYSVLSTTRNALFLPVGRSEKYEGKTTTDTFFWRFGDLASGVATWVFRNLLPQGSDFVFYNIVIGIVLSFILLGLAIVVGRQYQVLAKKNLLNAAPQLNKPIPSAQLVPGKVFSLALAHDTFVDNDPGDLLVYSAEMHSGGGLPGWINFDTVGLVFSGNVPTGAHPEIVIQVTATDDEGLFVSDTLRIEFGESM